MIPKEPQFHRYGIGNNSNIVDLAYKIQKSIEEINKVLIYKKKEDKLVYLIEHEPNGKQYHFKSNEQLNITQLVHCDTIKGLQYGVIVGTEYISDAKYSQLKECRRIN